mgnify:FL=1
MNKRKIFLRIIIFFTLLNPSIFSGEYHVPGDYAAIQEAIDASENGDEIIVSPGRYRETIDFKGKDIILRSTDPYDPSIIKNTIIDGQRIDSVVTFSGGETPACRISGFTITQGAGKIGGGLSGNNTRATIENNIIIDNVGIKGIWPFGLRGGIGK